tara:strand:- start:7069 stop:9279 length:2211 start_codon:yes stop_codon:yes gene_type:complete
MFSQILSAQDYYWTGNGDGTDFFQEANWIDSTSGLNPDDETINPSQPIEFNLFLTCEVSTFSSEVTDIYSQTPELFNLQPNNQVWPYVFIATTNDDLSSQEAQIFIINVTSLPTEGADYRVVKSVSNGNWYYGPSQALTLGINTISVNSVNFNRTVKFQFTSGAITFNEISLNDIEVYSVPDRPILLAPSSKLSISNGTLEAENISGGSLLLNENSYVYLSDSEPLLYDVEVYLESDSSWLSLENINPNQVFDDFSSRLFVSDVVADYPINIRFDNYYDKGTIIRTHNDNLSPLTIYSGENSSGISANILIDQVFSGSSIPNQLNNNIESFYLKRGYMLTLALNDDGTGKSKVYIASEEDLELRSLPEFLRNKVSFIRIVPWNWVSKKGTAGNIQGMDNTWYYRWNNQGYSDLKREYVPMSWGYGGANEPSDIEIYQSKYKATHVLAFNEPDNCEDQSGQYNNLCDVNTAIGVYENLMKTGLRLVSPACRQGAAFNWLDSFNQLAIENDIRIDVIALHWYDWNSDPEDSPNANPENIFNRFVNYLEAVHALYGLPIWITEFNGNKYRTEEVNHQFMELAIPYLESLAYVERYSWFEPVSGTADFYDASMNLTEIGEFYKNHESNASIPESFYIGQDNLDATIGSNNFEFECIPFENSLSTDHYTTPLKNKLKVFPNPASNKIKVYINEEIRIINIYSINGVFIKKITNHNDIDISKLKKGIYIIKVNQYYSKFLKI